MRVVTNNFRNRFQNDDHSEFIIEDPPGGSTAASPFERVRSWKERAVGISGVLGVPGVSGVRGVPGAFVMKHFGRNGN